MKNNSNEILTSIKELVGLSKKEVASEVEVKEEVVLSTEANAEESVELAEEKEQPKQEAPIQVNFATQEELSQVKQELLSMIKAMMEDKSDYSESDVPAKLSAEEKEAIELSEVVEEEVVHSPETEVKKKSTISFSKSQGLSTAQFINQNLYN